MADKKIVRHALDLARKCIHSGQPPQAFGHLNSIRAEMDTLIGNPLWAEDQSIYAVALAAMNDLGAEAAFREALSRIASLAESDLLLEMTTRGDFAKYLAGRCDHKRSREQYQEAEKIADKLELAEDVAHFQLCIIRIDLKEDGNPQLPAFQKLRGTTKEGYTAVEQRDAWIHYTEEVGLIGKHLVAARKGGEASVDYFRGVLSEIRRSRK
jgi:hypothetical protein